MMYGIRSKNCKYPRYNTMVIAQSMATVLKYAAMHGNRQWVSVPSNKADKIWSAKFKGGVSMHHDGDIVIIPCM